MDKTREEPGYIMSKGKQQEVMEYIETLEETPLSNKTVDKVKEAFLELEHLPTKEGEQFAESIQGIDEEYSFNYAEGFYYGWKSRDKEIHRLEQIATENSDWFDALKIDFNKQKEEIKKLKNALGEIDGNELL